MKKFLNKFVMLFLILTVSFGISTVAFAYDDAEIISVNEQYLDSWNTTDFNEYLSDDSIDESSAEQFTKWQTIKDELGELTSVDETVVTEEDGVITAVTTATYENNTLQFTITYDTETVESYGAMYGVASIDAQTASAGTSGSPSMAKAGMNTLMGMGIVFIVLILISAVISLLKYVPALFDKFSGNKKDEEVSQSINQVVSNIEETETNLVDDSELVAVMTAAIMAMESENACNASQGGFVVRSIRRRR